MIFFLVYQGIVITIYYLKVKTKQRNKFYFFSLSIFSNLLKHCYNMASVDVHLNKVSQMLESFTNKRKRQEIIPIIKVSTQEGDLFIYLLFYFFCQNISCDFF